MKRDWDLIRDVLIEVEGIDPTKLDYPRYGPLAKKETPAKDSQAVLLWKGGFIEGVDVSSLDGGDSVLAQGLTWQGHELLDTIRSKPVWEKIKSTAKDKGVELTFDAVIMIGKKALQLLLG